MLDISQYVVLHPCWTWQKEATSTYRRKTSWWIQIFLFSPLFEEDSHFDEYFQGGWNHQLEKNTMDSLNCSLYAGGWQFLVEIFILQEWNL